MKKLFLCLTFLLSLNCPAVAGESLEAVVLKVGQTIRCGEMAISNATYFGHDGDAPFVRTYTNERINKTYDYFRNRADKSQFDVGFVSLQFGELTEYAEFSDKVNWAIPVSHGASASMYVQRELARVNNEDYYWGRILKVFKKTEKEYFVVEYQPGMTFSRVCEMM